MNLQENIRKILKEESKKSKQTLHNLIEEDGLYDVMKLTGTRYDDIVSQVGVIRRSMLIDYIKDAVEDLQQEYHYPTRGVLDMFTLTGNIALYENDEGQMVFVDVITYKNNKLEFSTFIINEEGYPEEFQRLSEEEMDTESLEKIVSRISNYVYELSNR